MEKDNSEIDISNILQLCNIDYKEHNKYYRIHCFSGNHPDNDPSMFLYKDSGVAFCFSCGFKIYINQIYKKFLGKELDLEKYRLDWKKPKKIKERAVNDIIIRGDLISIYSNEVAHQYAQRKGLHKDFIENFNVKVLKMGSITVGSNKPMNVYNRLYFPVVENKTMVSIELRDYTESSSKKVLYPPDTNVSTLFGIDQLDYTKPLFLVEGIKSLWKLWLLERNSTSCFGIEINERQKDMLLKFPEIILLPDNDNGGNRFISNLSKFYYHKPIYISRPIPCGFDPNDITIDELKYILYEKRQELEKWRLEQNGFFIQSSYAWR